MLGRLSRLRRNNGDRDADRAGHDRRRQQAHKPVNRLGASNRIAHTLAQQASDLTHDRHASRAELLLATVSSDQIGKDHPRVVAHFACAFMSSPSDGIRFRFGFRPFATPRCRMILVSSRAASVPALPFLR
jgi:hypothetical protein